MRELTTIRRTKVLSHLCLHPNLKATKMDIARVGGIEVTKTSTSKVYQFIDAMIDDGLIAQDPSGEWHIVSDSPLPQSSRFVRKIEKLANEFTWKSNSDSVREFVAWLQKYDEDSDVQA